MNLGRVQLFAFKQLHLLSSSISLMQLPMLFVILNMQLHPLSYFNMCKFKSIIITGSQSNYVKGGPYRVNACMQVFPNICLAFLLQLRRLNFNSLIQPYIVSYSIKVVARLRLCFVDLQYTCSQLILSFIFVFICIAKYVMLNN